MVVQRLVSEVMTRPVISVTPQTPLQEAVKLLSEHHISGLPVVDGGKLVGELSEQQLMAPSSPIGQHLAWVAVAAQGAAALNLP